MFFVFHFLVFAYLTHSEINCFTQATIRATNYVRKHEEISNFRGAVPSKGANHKTNKLADLKSNVFDKILSDEMLSVEHRHNIKNGPDIPSSLSSKHHLVTPTLEIKQKWPMFKYLNNVNDVVRKAQNKISDSKKKLLQKVVKNDEDYLEYLPKSDTPELKLEANKPEGVNGISKADKISGLKLEIHKASKDNSFNNKVIGMRSISGAGEKNKCTCRKTNESGTCNKCIGNKNNKKRCTHSTPNVRAHECSRYGVTNHSCSQGQQFQSQPVFVTSNPYSFYPVYLPYSYFASEPPMVPYKVSYPQPNPLNELKIPRKHKHRCHKFTTRLEDDLYYEDNDSRERRPYDDNEYYQETKKISTNIVYDVNQDALIKEIVKDLKLHNNKDFVKECYCDSSLSLCRVNNMSLFILTILCFAL